MPTAENHIIARLMPMTRQRLLARCERFELRQDALLSERGQPLRYAVFPGSGFVALVIETVEHSALEVGMIGRESVLGAELILGVARSPWRALVLGPGEGWRIQAQALREVSATHPDLQKLLQGSVLVRLHQQALASACDRFHSIASRLARWMLMSQDRAQSPHFHVTQEFMARMLGVRRVSITLAASDLQREGLVSYRRGEVSVLDRTRLQARACSCYATDRRLMRAMVTDCVRQPTYTPD
jgi:CRP-like cAMP-binding protein